MNNYYFTFKKGEKYEGTYVLVKTYTERSAMQMMIAESYKEFHSINSFSDLAWLETLEDTATYRIEKDFERGGAVIFRNGEGLISTMNNVYFTGTKYVCNQYFATPHDSENIVADVVNCTSLTAKTVTASTIICDDLNVETVTCLYLNGVSQNEC